MYVCLYAIIGYYFVIFTYSLFDIYQSSILVHKTNNKICVLLYKTNLISNYL